jgi:NitT/TauT family transport system permease protein
MVANAQKSPTSPALARAENPPTDYSAVRRVVSSLVLLLLLGLLWEGLKAFAESTNYALPIGSGSIDLTVFNDQQLPHLGAIFNAFLQPAQRNGPPLLQELIGASAFTLQMALVGFALGGIIGFLLAVLFAHSRLMQGGCLPYVVASQTVPILAIAPMIVIWMGQAGLREWSIPVIAAYLTFFPVVIYTLRGLTAVPPTALELMQSYAANRWEILTKLRLPNALPHIFTALKLSATASVVGAIIGELPSGFQQGLGIAILNFARSYTQSPERLWATIVMSGVVGIGFFVVIVIIERLVVRWRRPEEN